MHHALEIQEILANIIGHYRPSYGSGEKSDLAALARTCRTFKEPALDVLWEVLHNLSPIAQCLPEASHRPLSLDEYSFTRPLTQDEWDNLRSYTCRIQSIYNFHRGLDWESVSTFLIPPFAGSLFPNLRSLHCTFTKKSMPLLHLPLPSLVSLDIKFENLHVFQNSLQSFPKFSPKIRRLCIHVYELEATFGKFEPNYIRRWENLRSLDCPQILLDMDELVHFSRMPALTWLSFTLSATFPPSGSDPHLVFSTLHDLRLKSESLEPISRLLSQTRLATITTLATYIDTCPSKHELSSFFAAVQTSDAGRTVENLWLIQSSPSSNVALSEDLLLRLQELLPCVAFSNLRCIKLNIAWKVGLTDSDLLALASTWPYIEHLAINADFGWNTPGGITPNGLLQLLQTCRSLSRISLAIDTQGYTEMPASGSLANPGLTLPPTFYINVLDSVIEADSVPAVAAFLAGIAPCWYFYFSAWDGFEMARPPNWDVYKDRWNDVYRLANEAISPRA
ncbi:hypothetical protein L210DRAFT_3767970 [Boletus edulis BED1]|uniref:Uncharacterized protein n=1 Tax=Boletus edulis BED1 TaxID=1328754 RepID=A0AAD4BAJ7_BOLED|nr:hypothetical protein L210DRAFT_3767970 [Boletus edulis BED1]